jgi:hypothetical protein
MPVTAPLSRSLLRPRRVLVGALGAAAAVFLLGAPAALADSATSVNWAGYVAHRPGVHFRRVTGEWRIPTPSCTPGASGYSSAWVGLGGYSANSNALEQAGVEVDCSSSGRGAYFAWSELVPARPETIPLTVRQGDLVRATVTTSGRRVTIRLADLTRRRTFQKSSNASRLDTAAADWIVEAPSECTNAGQCITLPLTDFGRTSFRAAGATSVQGHSGAITSGWWSATKITLVPRASQFFAETTDGLPDAIPSALTAGGSAFAVSFAGSSQSASSGPFFGALGAHPLVGRLVHPKR